MSLKEFWARVATRYTLDCLKDYLDILETHLEKAKEDFKNLAKAEAAKVPPSEREEIDDFFKDEEWRYSKVFPRILRNSFLVTLHSVLESELVWICESLRTEKGISTSWHNLKKGNVLKRLKDYISKECRLNFPKGQSWKEINKYKDIRNCIVHAAGNVRALGSNKKEKGLRDYCSKQAGICIDKDGNLVLSKEFCLQAVSTVQTFFEELYDSYEGKKAP